MHKNFDWKTERKRLLERPRRRWSDIRMHFREKGWEVVTGYV
jgi:hypothetical protein